MAAVQQQQRQTLNNNNNNNNNKENNSNKNINYTKCKPWHVHRVKPSIQKFHINNARTQRPKRRIEWESLETYVIPRYVCVCL